MFAIYIITCKINNKVYVGQTCRTIATRWKEHVNDTYSKKKRKCHKLHSAIKKYLPENFYIEEIFLCKTLQDANFYEQHFIKEFDSLKLGYNLNEGGKNAIPSQETRQKMRKRKLGINNFMFGKTHTEEVKRYSSMINKGRVPPNKGILMSENQKSKISASRKGITAGENNPGAKLSLGEVTEIKHLINQGNYTRKEIASKFRVSLSTIKRIKTGTHWK